MFEIPSTISENILVRVLRWVGAQEAFWSKGFGVLNFSRDSTEYRSITWKTERGELYLLGIRKNDTPFGDEISYQFCLSMKRG